MKYGTTETGIPFEENLYRYIRITDIDSNGTLKNEGKLSLTDEQAEGYILKNNTLLFARSGATVGKSFLYRDTYGKAAFAGYLISACPDTNKTFPEWIYYYTNSSAYWEWANRIFTQATIQNIGADKYSNMQLPVAELKEQKRIIAYLDRQCGLIDSVIEKTKGFIEEYKKLRQAVITQAVTKGVRGDRPMKDSGYEWISEVPAEWSLIPSKYLFGNSDARKQPDDVQLTASQKHGIISQQEYMELENAKIVFANQGIGNWKHVEPNDFIISLRSPEFYSFRR